MKKLIPDQIDIDLWSELKTERFTWEEREWADRMEQRIDRRAPQIASRNLNAKQLSYYIEDREKIQWKSEPICTTAPRCPK